MVAVAVGSPFLVNGIAPGVQYRPVISNLANGGFVIAWQDASGQGSPDNSDDVRFARFDALGVRLTPFGVDTLANSTTDSAQFEASIGRFEDGKFVIVWTDASENAPDFDNRSVRGQVFNADGSKSGSEFMVNSTYPLSQNEPSVTVLSNGMFVVTWTSEIITDSSATNIIGRLFNANGTPAGSEFTINTQTAGNQARSETHALSTGGFAVVWDDRETIGTPDDQIQTYIRFYSAGGAPISAAIIANSAVADLPQEVDLAELSDGRIIITYSDYDIGTGDGSGAAVRARFYNPIAGTFGPVINVNTTTLNDQYDAQVAALDNGQFVVVWTDNSKTGGDLSFEAVRMQVFNSAGAKVGGEILVNVATTFEQQNPVVTVLADGRFIVSWEDNSQTGGDTQGMAIRARMYDARVIGIDVDGTSGADTYQGSSFADTINGLAGNDKIFGGGGIDVILGGIGTDDLSGGDGDDDLDGGAQNDTLNGGAGNDTLTGGVGADTMIGGPGNDIYIVDNIGDQVFEAAGNGTNDQVFANVNFTLAAGQNIEVINTFGSGTTNNVNLTGNEIGQTLIGNAGVNTLDGKGGADQMRGFAGNDTYIVDNAGDQVIETAGNGTNDQVFANVNFTLAAGQNIEVINTFGSGTTNNVNLTGNEIGQTLIGNAGVNTLDGKGGADQMRGFAGNDTYIVDNVGDQVIETAGNGTNDQVFANVNFTLAAGQNIEVINTFGSGTTNNVNLTGNEIGQTLMGNAGVNTLDGKGGADQMRGFAGNDTYIVDNVGDQVIETAGNGTNDQVFANVNFTLAAGQNIEVINTFGSGTTNNVNLTGNEIGQTLIGNAGVNTLDGKGGADQMRGFAGNDTYIVDNVGDQVIETAGNGTGDQVFTSVNFTLAAGQHIETLAIFGSATTSNLNLTGNEFANTLISNTGSNIINGKGGNDVLYGFGGVDYFVFDTTLNAATNVDRIMDFNVAADTIRLENAIFTALTTTGTLASGAFRTGAAAADASDRIIYNSATGALLYDADGLGGAAATRFGTLNTGLALTNADFVVI